MNIKAVRYKHNYCYVTIENNGDFNGPALTANEIPVLLRSGQKKFYKFGGSRDVSCRYNEQLVKVVDLDCYTFDSTDVLRRHWNYVGRNNYCAGILLGGLIFLLVENGNAVVREQLAASRVSVLSPKSSNVVPLFSAGKAAD